jgi:nucleotide-binding universal stress UspA family protein
MSATTASTNRVLIPVDDSEFGLHVLPHVTRLLGSDKNELILLHVAPAPNAVIVGTEVVIYADQETASMEATCLQAMQPYVRSLEEMGYRVKPMVAFGEPAAEIEHIVAQKNVDLVAMTTHGRTGLARVLHGSVAQHVINHVDVPVLLFRLGSEEEEEEVLASVSLRGA